MPLLLCPEETGGAQRLRRRGDPGVQPLSKGRCAAALPHNRIHRDRADVSSGERACLCSSILRRLVVRDVCAGGGTRACSVSAGRCAAALPHNRIHGDGADVSSGEQACPCAVVLRGAAPRGVGAGGGTRVRSVVSVAQRPALPAGHTGEDPTPFWHRRCDSGRHVGLPKVLLER